MTCDTIGKLAKWNTAQRTALKQNFLTHWSWNEWLKMLDFLPEAQLCFRSILLQICFVNQAFLGHQFFQVQGRNGKLLRLLCDYYI
jgi:hypothetical protein